MTPRTAFFLACADLGYAAGALFCDPDCTIEGMACVPGGRHASEGLCYPAGPEGDGDACPPFCQAGLVCGSVDGGHTGECMALCDLLLNDCVRGTCVAIWFPDGDSIDYGMCAVLPG